MKMNTKGNNLKVNKRKKLKILKNNQRKKKKLFKVN